MINMQGSLYQLVRQAQKDEKAAEKLLDTFRPKIKKTLLQTSFDNREDLDQELNIKLLDLMHKYNIEAAVGFWEFKNLTTRNQET